MEYLFAFQLWYCELCSKNWWGEGRKHVLFDFVLWLGSALIVSGWWVVGCCRRFYIEPAEIASFSNRDFSRSNRYNTFWHVSTEYFYVLFLWTIAVTDFRHLKIYKNVGLPLSTFTFTVNSYAINHFHKYICFK